MQLRVPFLIKKILDVAINQTSLTEKLVRPYVILDVYPKRSINMLYFRIRNVGKTPAYQIAVTPKEVIPFRKQSSSDLPIFQNPISALGPGEELSFFYESAIELFSRENPILKFYISAEYYDSTKHRYHDNFYLNLEIFKGLSLDMPASDRLVKELERIQRDIEKISRSVDRIAQYELQKEWKENPIEQNNTDKEDTSK